MLRIDDQELFRAVLRNAVLATPGMTPVGEPSSGETALDAVEELSPEMVTMDRRMAGIGGVEAGRLIRARRPKAVVVLVAVEAPDPGGLEDSGAATFIDKPSPRTDVWRTYDA